MYSRSGKERTCVYSNYRKPLLRTHQTLTETNETVSLRSFLPEANTEIDLNQIFSKYLNFALFEFFFQMFL